jgi:hypothetical protein
MEVISTCALRVASVLWVVGAVAGVIFYAGNLYRESGGEARPAFGCEKPPGYDIVNLPARALAIIYPVEALAPQQFGEAEDPRRSAAWSPVAFMGLGAGFYAVSGLIIGAAAGRAMRTRARGGRDDRVSSRLPWK